MVKQAQITNIETEIDLLQQEMTDLDVTWQKRINQCENMIAENLAVIKRQDKLAVDLQQKNEVC